MPRPGPRPYECVRRAWHSDRHLPLRGSLIQELFRIVNEVHSPSTRKNKEWQEKLPVVVLKAEEIMYSKANSEAEYVDLNTLWDRANDAINTIIRRDESTETGVLLQPCIEAALHLGCTPRKTSRSQRNNTPRCYLNPGNPETPTIVPLSNLECKIQGNYAPSCSLIPQSSENSAANLMSPSKYLDTFFPSSCSVYPLYYGKELHFKDPKSLPPIQKVNNNEDYVVKKKLHSSRVLDGSNIDHSKLSPDTPPGTGCNLSLRLGPLEASSCLENEVGINSCDNDGLDKPLPRGDDHEFSFFPKKGDVDHLNPECCSAVKWILEAQKQNADQVSLRKRKPEASHASADDRTFCWPQKIPFKQFSRTD
ncbi:OLC1v1032839C1 [Oldenlandia corymbosa var. corymbosa]|uniref:OLC1v1032839C1 n=1 Tax=Oldenlandia corymbosa var. corymbosa TaxID=529605 RepID=A0AAV1CMP6_OLDCO|nr:OLC1v1032839C1 [Oldenlandia corymbosa var. corymbosa]